MKTVVVKACNLRTGDILNGGRIRHKTRFPKRLGTGVLVLTPHPKGYDVITYKFDSEQRVKIKRPACNMTLR